MKVKKLIATVLCLTMLVSSAFLTGCARKVDEIDWNVDLNNKIELNIHYPMSGYSDSDFQNGLTAEVLKESSGYTVNYTQLQGGNEEILFENALNSQGQYHAIKMGYKSYEKLVHSDGFQDLTELLNLYGKDLLENISQEAWDAVTYNGKIMAIPEAAFAGMIDNAIVFNKNHLAQAGISKIPETLGEFSEALSKLQTEYRAGNQNYYPLAIPGALPDFHPISSTFDLPERFYEDSSGNVKHYINHAGFRPYVEYMNSLVVNGRMASEWSEYDGAKIMGLFAQGNISVAYMPYWDVKPLIKMMAARNDYKDEQAAWNAIDWTLKIAGDGSGGSQDQRATGAKVRTAIGISQAIVIPYYMRKNAVYTIDHLNSMIKEENFKKYLLGKEGVTYKTVDETTANAIKIEYDGETEYYELLPGYDSYRENSMYSLGNNGKVAKAYWPLREKGFGVWEVLVENPSEDPLVLTDVLALRPTFKYFSAGFITAESALCTNFQATINHTRNAGRWTFETRFQNITETFNKNFWSGNVESEINAWYKANK